MKHIIIILTVIVSQQAFAQFEYGIKAGLGSGGLTIYDQDPHVTTGNIYKPKMYYQLGVEGIYSPINNLFLKTGLGLNSIGTDNIAENWKSDGSDTLLLHIRNTFLQIPISLQYELFWNIRIELGMANHFVLIKSKQRSPFTDNDKSYDPAWFWGASITLFKHFEIGYTDYNFWKYFGQINYSEAYLKHDAWCVHLTYKQPINFKKKNE